LKHNLKLLVIYLAFAFSFNLLANRLVMYKAPAFFEEARLTTDYLTTFECNTGGGNTYEGYNRNGDKTNVLNIYGPENFRRIAQGVPDPILDLNPGSILNNLWETSLPGFGEVILKGRFKLNEVNFNYWQNFKHGLFLEVNLPVCKLSIIDFRYEDLSTPAEAGSVNFGQWQSFLVNMASNLEPYGISLNACQNFKFADIVMSLGWAQTNLEKVKFLDFWDTSIKAGILFPTAPAYGPQCPLMVNPGYNKNLAFPFSFDLALGLFEWVTFGAHVEGILFTSKYQMVGLKTNQYQNGLIKLAQGTALVEKGNIWQIGAFAKSDHMPWGLSILVAYAYSAEQKTVVRPTNDILYDFTLVNSDNTLAGWHMHVINTIVEYDFAVEQDKRHLPYVRLNFDIPFAGQYVFKNTMFSGTLGVNWTW
jgi:hypothetical protein